MPEYFEPVSFERHGGLKWSHAADFSFTADLVAVPLIAREVLKASHHYRLGLVPVAGHVRPVALLAPEGEHAYLRADGSWAAPYLPFVLRTFPLRLLRAAGSERHVLAAASDPGTVNAERGSPFYASGGELAEATTQMLTQLYKAIQGDDRVFAALALFRAAGLLEPLPPAKTAEANGSAATRRLFRVSARNLAGLDGAALAELHAQSAEAAEIALAVCFSWSMAPRSLSAGAPQAEPPRATQKEIPTIQDELVKLLDFDEKIWL